MTYHEHFASYFKEEQLKPFIHLLSKRMESGHVCIPIDESIDAALIECGYTGIDKTISLSNLVSSEESDPIKKPFIFYNNKFYLQRYFQYETTILKRLKDLTLVDDHLSQERKNAVESQNEFILSQISKKEDISNFSEIEKPDWQAVAAIQGVLNNLTIVTGGPGTGKTTTVAKILALLNKIGGEDLSVALAAPTGKAAVRMKESLMNSVTQFPDLDIKKLLAKTEAKTIHRLLGTKLNSPFFKHNKENPLPFDVVVIDEASMISVAMFAKLLDAIGLNTRLIILGDSDQLASVDAGSLFGDICTSQKETACENKFEQDHLTWLNKLLQSDRQLNMVLEGKTSFLAEQLVRLKKTYRYNQDSRMGKFTQAVINGNSDKLESIINLEDDGMLSVDFEYDPKIFEEFILKYSAYIEEPIIEKALKKINNCRVLCAVKQSDQGVYKLNERIQAFLKNKYKTTPKLFNPNSEIYYNQLIIVTKNQPDLKLSNGDVGIVRGEKDNLKVYFPPVLSDNSEDASISNNYLEINPGYIEQWEPVFAMTIHKSQGSEFDEVFVVLPKKGGDQLLTRELLYTGVTRAKNKAHIQSSLEVLKTTTQNCVKRTSGINDRIKNKN